VVAFDFAREGYRYANDGLEAQEDGIAEQSRLRTVHCTDLSLPKNNCAGSLPRARSDAWASPLATRLLQGRCVSSGRDFATTDERPTRFAAWSRSALRFRRRRALPFGRDVLVVAASPRVITSDAIHE
jgi:hypothetical protein